MNAEYAKMRRHLDSAVTEMNNHLDNAENKKNPERHAMITATAKDALAGTHYLNMIEGKSPYSDSNIGYGANRSEGTHDNTSNTMYEMMAAINKVLPHVANSYNNVDDDAEARRRRGRSGRFVRNDFDNDEHYNAYMRVEDRHAENVTRAAAEAAAATAKHMSANTHEIYPGTPIMPHNTHDERNMHDAFRPDNTTGPTGIRG